MRASRTQFFGLPRLLAQLEIEYTDGTIQTIASDESWKVTSNGPIIANNEFDGEEYDARKELPGWSEPNYDDSAWKTVDLMTAPEGVMTAQPNPNICLLYTSYSITSGTCSEAWTTTDCAPGTQWFT